ncbi:MAG TPA: hypothetical protein DCQ31_03205, partial [Bacteroidales bacterium]|nr:hypothetical protein [Bacteroidales bacterium]
NTLSYALISGNDRQIFELNQTTGELRVTDATHLNFEATPKFELGIKITDNGYNKLSTQIKVQIELTNEADTYPEPDADNVFSPNGDQINDTWVVRNVHEFAGCELIIFNSQGKTVFKTVSYDNSWSGDGLPADTYYFIFTCGGRVTNKSYITLVK